MARSKKMEIRLINIIIVIGLIIIISFFVINNKNKEKQNIITNQPEIVGKTEKQQEEKYVKVLEDGTKLNISEKLNKDKKIDNLEIKDIQLKYKDGVTNLLATIENTNNAKLEMEKIEITLIDENGDVIYKIPGIIEETESGKTARLNCSVTADFVNAYDFEMTRK